MLRFLIRPLDGSGELTATLYQYSRIYASQIVLLTVLSAMTIFRREMSCNRVFHEGDDAQDQADEAQEEEGGQAWDELLEGAGKWGSGKPLMEMVQSIWGSMMRSKERVKSTNKRSENWTEEMSDELLEGAGLSLSGEPFCSAVVSLWARVWLTSLVEHERSVSKPSPLSNDLSPDVQVHILSFLHPKDITAFACCSTDCNILVNSQDSDTCLQLWKTLWDRDYAWLIESWDVGIEARKRSLIKDRPVDKQLYFEFGQTYTNYLLAGHNTMQDCLVGLHGNIYDITKFLDDHPGSPETLLAYAGQDAARHFEDIGHSGHARKRAVTLCVVVDLSCHDEHGFGVRRGTDVGDSIRIVPSGRQPGRQARRPGTLHKVRKQLLLDERKSRRAFLRSAPNNILTEITVYYDAFDRRWKAWYTDYEFETQYL
jgi:hypothetical protein